MATVQSAKLEPTNRTIDFSTVLASSVHDMKNSLCLLIQSIENLSDKLEMKGAEEAQELAGIHYEASRLNSNLLQILSLYREDCDSLPMNIDEYYLDEVLEELVAKNQLYIDNRQLNVSFEVEEDLVWYFDNELIANLLNDIFVNAMRYCQSTILVKAFEQDGLLKVQIIDDGAGYPANMLDKLLNGPSNFSITMSRTGLGLYFAKLIASKHVQDGRCGKIELENGGLYNGSVFTLTLP